MWLLYQYNIYDTYNDKLIDFHWLFKIGTVASKMSSSQLSALQMRSTCADPVSHAYLF